MSDDATHEYAAQTDGTLTEVDITGYHMADVDNDGQLDNVEVYQDSTGYTEIDVDLDDDHIIDASAIDTDGDGTVDMYVATPAAYGDASDTGSAASGK